MRRKLYCFGGKVQPNSVVINGLFGGCVIWLMKWPQASSRERQKPLIIGVGVLQLIWACYCNKPANEHLLKNSK
jgi:hypothetical protein